MTPRKARKIRSARAFLRMSVRVTRRTEASWYWKANWRMFYAAKRFLRKFSARERAGTPWQVALLRSRAESRGTDRLPIEDAMFMKPAF